MINRMSLIDNSLTFFDVCSMIGRGYLGFWQNGFSSVGYSEIDKNKNLKELWKKY